MLCKYSFIPPLWTVTIYALERERNCFIHYIQKYFRWDFPNRFENERKRSSGSYNENWFSPDLFPSSKYIDPFVVNKYGMLNRSMNGFPWFLFSFRFSIDCPKEQTSVEFKSQGKSLWSKYIIILDGENRGEIKLYLESFFFFFIK